MLYNFNNEPNLYSMKRDKVLLMTFVGLLFIRCSNKEVGDKTGTEITDKIVIKVSEAIINGKGNLFISATTKDVYPCANYTIDTDFNAKNTSFNIYYKKIIVPVTCLDALGVASNKIEIGTLPNGTYNLELHVPSGKSNGVLKVSATELQLNFRKTKGIEIPEPIVKRVK